MMANTTVRTGPPAVVRTVVYLDVDGVLNPYMMDRGTLPKDAYSPFRWETIPAAHNGGETGMVTAMSGRQAAAVKEAFRDVDVLWLTTWQQDAPAWFAPTVGLPDWPYLPFVNEGPRPIACKRARLFQHQQQEGPRPFVWIDDDAHLEYGNLLDQFTDAGLPVPAHHVVPSGHRKGHMNPRAGLRQSHLDHITAFLQR